jgi:hypothetical protein
MAAMNVVTGGPRRDHHPQRPGRLLRVPGLTGQAIPHHPGACLVMGSGSSRTSRAWLVGRILEFICACDGKARLFRWSYDGRPLKAA